MTTGRINQVNVASADPPCEAQRTGSNDWTMFTSAQAYVAAQELIRPKRNGTTNKAARAELNHDHACVKQRVRKQRAIRLRIQTNTIGRRQKDISPPRQSNKLELQLRRKTEAVGKSEAQCQGWETRDVGYHGRRAAPPTDGTQPPEPLLRRSPFSWRPPRPSKEIGGPARSNFTN